MHLSLGIFDRIWTLLEENCTELDLKLAESSGSDLGGSTFSDYSGALKERSLLLLELNNQKSFAALTDQLATYFTLSLANPQTSDRLSEMKKTAAATHKRISEMV